MREIGLYGMATGGTECRTSLILGGGAVGVTLLMCRSHVFLSRLCSLAFSMHTCVVRKGLEDKSDYTTAALG